MDDWKRKTGKCDRKNGRLKLRKKLMKKIRKEGYNEGTEERKKLGYIVGQMNE
jgi:hypothetical protein